MPEVDSPDGLGFDSYVEHLKAMPDQDRFDLYNAISRSLQRDHDLIGHYAKPDELRVKITVLELAAYAIEQIWLDEMLPQQRSSEMELERYI